MTTVYLCVAASFSLCKDYDFDDQLSESDYLPNAKDFDLLSEQLCYLLIHSNRDLEKPFFSTGFSFNQQYSISCVLYLKPLHQGQIKENECQYQNRRSWEYPDDRAHAF